MSRIAQIAAIMAMAMVESSLDTPRKPNTNAMDGISLKEIDVHVVHDPPGEDITLVQSEARIKRLERNRTKIAKGAWKHHVHDAKPC
jgi:hypothetical protein